MLNITAIRSERGLGRPYKADQWRLCFEAALAPVAAHFERRAATPGTIRELETASLLAMHRVAQERGLPADLLDGGCRCEVGPGGATVVTLPRPLLQFLDRLDVQEMPERARVLRADAGAHRDRAEQEIKRAERYESEADEIEAEMRKRTGD